MAGGASQAPEGSFILTSRELCNGRGGNAGGCYDGPGISGSWLKHWETAEGLSVRARCVHPER